jgi:hypothetical protein
MKIIIGLALAYVALHLTAKALNAVAYYGPRK